MEQLETIIGIQDFFLYKGEDVLVYYDKIQIGNKVFQKNLSDTVFYSNGLLLVEGYEVSPMDEIEEHNNPDLGISFYNGERFERLECGYSHDQIRHIYAPDVFCHAEFDKNDDCYKVVFSEEGDEYEFVNDCGANLFDFFYNTKRQVLVFIHHGFHIFFSKTGEKLWSLEMTDDFKMMFDVDSFEPDSDSYIIKVTKNNKPYTVCYNVLTGEVMWEHEDNTSVFFGGVRCEDGMLRGLWGHDEDSILLFEMNPENGESELFILKDGADAVKFEGKINEATDQYYLYTLEGEKMYFIKNYSTYQVNDQRERTVGVVDLKQKTVDECVCCTGFCSIKQPIVNNGVVNVFVNHPSKELFRFDFSKTSVKTEKKALALKKPLSGNYNVLLKGNYLVYIFEEDAFVVDIKNGGICQKFAPLNSKYTPLTAAINGDKLSVSSFCSDGNNNNQPERHEYAIPGTMNEPLDSRVDVDLIETLLACRGIFDGDRCYRLFFFKTKVFLLSNSEIVIVDLSTKALKDRVIPEGFLIYPESTMLNGNMLCVYMKKASVDMYYFDLNRDNPFESLTKDRFKPTNFQEEYQLGDYYLRGAANFPQSDEKAAEWFAKSAMHGHMVAQFELGNCFKNGVGVRRNNKYAVKWWTKSAMQGFAKSQYNLAECYETGTGTAKNLTKAIIWYMELAEKGHEGAKDALKRIEKEGPVELYIVRAGRGDVDAQYALGSFYEEGRYVEQSNSEAYRWYEKAALAGHMIALRALVRLTRKA